MTESTSMYSGSDAGGEGVEASAALSVKQALDAEVAAIRDSHTLNEEGKQAAIAEAYVGAEKRYHEAIEREESEATDRIVAAEQALFKLSSGHAATGAPSIGPSTPA